MSDEFDSDEFECHPTEERLRQELSATKERLDVADKMQVENWERAIEAEAALAIYKAQAEEWAALADASQQPREFYKDYSEKTMRAMQALLTKERAALATARNGLKTVASLIEESYGVTGLHLNGDVAPWDELRTGGRFEGWLREFDRALAQKE